MGQLSEKRRAGPRRHLRRDKIEPTPVCERQKGPAAFLPLFSRSGPRELANFIGPELG